MKIALIRGPYLRPNGVVPWEELHRTTEYEVVGFNSDPKRFDASSLDFPVRTLPWWDGKLSGFGHDYIISKGLRRLRMPSGYLRGVSELTEEFDLLHTSENFKLFSFQAALATRNTDTEFAFAQGENIPYPLFQRNPLLWKMKQFINRQASGVTTTTPKGKRALIHEGMDPEKTKVIPNSIDGEMFAPKTPPSPDELGLPSKLKDSLTIVFVHGLKEQKGTPYLLNAFDSLWNSHDDVCLLLLGRNELDRKRTEFVESHPGIVWREHISYQRMPDVYNLCDISVLPSVTMANNEEQFGMAVLEAMACQLPTVVTDVGGLSYVTERNTTSLVVEERDFESLQSALERLIESAELRSKLGENGLERATTTFDRSSISADLKQFYDKILDRR